MPTEQVEEILKRAEGSILPNTASTAYSFKLLYNFLGPEEFLEKREYFERMLFELESRAVSFNHFAITIMYGQTRNVQKNLEFLDYLLENHRKELEDAVQSTITSSVIEKAGEEFRKLP